MKQVDIIISSSINHIGGPMGTMKRILKNKEYFNSRGYQVSIFTFESINIGPLDDVDKIPLYQAVPTKGSIFKAFSSLKRNMIMKSKYLTTLAYKNKNKKSQTLIDYYFSLHRNPDVVELHSHYDGSYYMINRVNTKPKCIVFFHSNGIPYDQELCTYPLLMETGYYRELREQLYQMIAGVDLLAFIAYKGQRNFLEVFKNQAKSKTIVLRNGIDDLSGNQRDILERIKLKSVNSKFKYRLCSVGTISFRKGQRLIIETLHSLPSEIISQIHIDFVGDGPERSILEELIDEYNLKNNVEFCGSVPNDDVYKFLARNNIYILMSKNEGLPISILEAMRAGLPIISTNVAGIPECIDAGINGFILEPNRIQLEEMFMKLSQFDWSKMGSNSYDKFKREFTFDRMRKEFCDMFDNLLL